jgi:Trypsin-like peptidase domain
MIDRFTNTLTKMALLSALVCSNALAQCPNGMCPSGQCTNGLCPVRGVSQPLPTSPQSLAPHAAHCRIYVGDGSMGSGTLVDRNEGAGLVLTCSHLFDDTSEGIVVAFPNGQRFAARLIDRDPAQDLAALVIQRPEIEPITVDDNEPSGMLTACGYGPDGQFRPLTGQITGRAIPAGATYPSVKLSGAVRPGDSGGGVLNAGGRLVGVVWGQRDGETYFNCGRSLRQFLDRVLNRQQNPQPGRQVVELPSPSAGPISIPIPGPQAPAANPPAWQEEIDNKLADRFGTLDDRLQAIDRQIQQVGQLADGDVGFFQGLSFGKLIVGTLGLSGPLAAAVVAAGGLIGRRIKSRAESQESRADGTPTFDSRLSTRDSQPVAVDTPPPPQRAVPETHYVPYERDAFARAHQWASEQVVRKYPGAVDVMTALDSLIKQQLNAQSKD